MALLAVLVGRAPESLKVRGGSLYGLGLPRLSPGLPSELLLQRPDIRSAEAQLAAADASVEAARAAFFPSISLTGQYGIASTALKNLFTPQAIFYDVAANLAQPVFDGFRLQGLLEQTKGRQIELLENYRKSIVSGFGDVEQALIAIADGAERERLQRVVVETSQARVRHRRNAPARGHRRPCHRADNAAGAVPGAGQSRHCQARPPAGRIEPVPGTRRRLVAARG